MSEERLWKFKRPEWMNSAAARSAGIYSAGGLVSNPFYHDVERRIGRPGFFIFVRYGFAALRCC